MINTFCKAPLWEVNQDLIQVALGRRPADCVIRHANLVDVCTREVLEDVDIALASGRIAYVGLEGEGAQFCIGDDTQVIDATGFYAAPGFLDGHIHVESAMIGVGQYARATVPHGTVGIFMDPHEITNVCGLAGMKAMMAEGATVPLKAMVTTPSCVPAVSGFETTGASIDASDIAETMEWGQVVGLGEMMNFPGILAAAEGPLDEVRETLKAGKTVTGHYSIPETDRGLNAYIASGISACHESLRAEDVLAKMRLGMYAQIREGSAWHNLHDLAPVIAEGTIDTRFACLVSDDNHPSTLLHKGHLDYLLKRAVEEGIDPVVAIQMVTINTATCFGLQQDMGSIAPGKCADLVLLKDLKDFQVTATFINGDLVAQDGQALFSATDYTWPEELLNTMHVSLDITPDTFRVPAVDEEGQTLPDGTACVRVIRMLAGRTENQQVLAKLKVRDGQILADPDQDILKACVIERHEDSHTLALGFVSGFGIHGALGQTVAHDAHNLLVIGDNDEDMALAALELIACGGGEIAVEDGQVLGKVELPIAGLMSPKPYEQVAEEVSHMEQVWRQMGCKMPSPFMTLGLLSLACIPDLRLTNLGYVDCNDFTFVPLIESFTADQA